MASRGCRRWLGSLHPLAVVLLLLAVVAAAAAGAAGSPDRTAPSRPPLVLPLTLSYPNASRVASSRSRRGLAEGGRPTARMRLHDDLLTNGSVQFGIQLPLFPIKFVGCSIGSEVLILVVFWLGITRRGCTSGRPRRSSR
jgi:hypothetical protein